MTKEIKYLDIVLETCAVIHVPFACVKRFETGRVERSFQYISQYKLNEQLLATEGYFDLDTSKFLVNRVHLSNSTLEGDLAKKQEAIDTLLNVHNITRLCLIYIDNTEMELIIPWKDYPDTSYENMYQTSWLQGSDIIHIDYNKNWSSGF